MNQPELQLRKNNVDMDVWEHVGELRRRLIRCIAAVALAFAVLVYIEPERVMDAVAAPVKEQGVQLIYLGLADALYVQLKVVFLCAVVLAAPVLLWQMWAFVRPALCCVAELYCQRPVNAAGCTESNHDGGSDGSAV